MDFRSLQRDSFLREKGRRKKQERKESRIYPVESEVAKDERPQQ